MEMEQIIRKLQDLHGNYQANNASEKDYARGITQIIVMLSEFISDNLLHVFTTRLRG